jgi:peroxiredoxin
MSEAPKTHWRWFLFAVRTLFTLITVFVVLEVIGLEVASWEINSDGLDGHPVAKAVFPWMNGLFRFSRFVLLATVLYATYAVFRKTGRECRRALTIAFIGLLVFVAGIAGWQALIYRVFLPGMAPPRPDFANMPGTLTSLGELAPDVAITTVDGPPIHLSDLRGRVVLLNFFATWCGPCKLELPDLQEIWNKFHDHDEFRMFVIGREESAETVRAFKDEHGFTFPMASDLDRSVFEHFATDRIPRTYLISRDGKILYQCTGYDFENKEILTLRTLLDKELGKRK